MLTSFISFFFSFTLHFKVCFTKICGTETKEKLLGKMTHLTLNILLYLLFLEFYQSFTSVFFLFYVYISVNILVNDQSSE